MPFPSFFRLLLVGVLAVAVAFVKQVLAFGPLRLAFSLPRRDSTLRPPQHRWRAVVALSRLSSCRSLGRLPGDGWLMAM